MSAKTEAAKRWSRAVNRSDKLRHWYHHVNEYPHTLSGELDYFTAQDF